ncbi:MAG: hypothetical protein V7K40_33460 [Nostoc sp.]
MRFTKRCGQSAWTVTDAGKSDEERWQPLTIFLGFPAFYFYEIVASGS